MCLSDSFTTLKQPSKIRRDGLLVIYVRFYDVSVGRTHFQVTLKLYTCYLARPCEYIPDYRV